MEMRFGNDSLSGCLVRKKCPLDIYWSILARFRPEDQIFDMVVWAIDLQV